MATTLQAKKRETTKKSINRKIRREGNIPAVVYGNELASQSIYVDNRDFIKTIRKVGRNGVITLKIEGDNNGHPVMVYDLQVDSIKDEFVHADFYKVDMSSEVDVDAAVHLIGESAGQKEGGVVQQLIHEITIRALPAEIPESIEVNIEELNIGDSVSVSDLKANKSYEILNDPDDVIVSVTPPSQEEEPEEESDSEEDQEPERVGEKSDDEEENE